MNTYEPVEKINSDVTACETCGASGDIETMTMMGDVWMCEKCVAASRKEFDACDHDWHPDEFNGEPGKYCDKCNWFIPATTDTPSLASTETFSDEELIAFLEKSAVDAGPGVAAKLREAAARISLLQYLKLAQDEIERALYAKGLCVGSILGTDGSKSTIKGTRFIICGTDSLDEDDRADLENRIGFKKEVA